MIDFSNPGCCSLAAFFVSYLGCYNIHMKSLIKNKAFFTLILIGIIFFFVYSFLPISQLNWQKQNNVDNISLRFNTPDEVINYYFTNQFAKTTKLYYFEPLDSILNRVVFPRWAFVIGNRVTPGNFLGLDLIYGSLAKIFSNFVIPFLTPFFAILGVLFFFLLIRKLLNEKIAFLSALLVFIFPGFWYYTSRTMFHNVLFLSLLIIGLYFLVKLFSSNKNKLLLSGLTGLFLGLALTARMSEIVLVFLMVLIILIFYCREFKKNLHYLFFSLIIAAACFIPILFQNKIVYDNYFYTGYNLNTMTEDLESGEVGRLNIIQAVFLPFGFHPRVLAYVIYNYILKLFWPWLILWLCGLLLFLQDIRSKDRSYKLYGYLLSVICYLLLYYGSWFFKDSVTGIISLGSSYVRYFLPLFIFNIPLIAYLIVKFWQKKNIYLKILFVLVLCLLFFVSGIQVYRQTPESLLAVRNQLIKYNIQAQDLLEYTRPDDLILLDIGTDKIFFPERKHLIVPQNGVEWPEVHKALDIFKAVQGCDCQSKIISGVYYFHHTDKVNADYLNQVKFNPQDLEIYAARSINGGGVLYKIKSQN